jgi:MFS family permease
LTTVTYAIAYFLPMILTYGMGYSVGVSQCLIAPPYFFAAILMFASSWFGDRYRMRGPVLIFLACVTLVGLPMMGFLKGNAARYVGVFLTTAGANSAIPAAMAYQANNIRGQWTRAFASATLVGFGGVGGIAGSLVFRSQDAPAYIPGIWAAIAYDISSSISPWDDDGPIN